LAGGAVIGTFWRELVCVILSNPRALEWCGVAWIRKQAVET